MHSNVNFATFKAVIALQSVLTRSNANLSWKLLLNRSYHCNSTFKRHLVHVFSRIALKYEHTAVYAYTVIAHIFVLNNLYMHRVRNQEWIGV